MRLIAELRRSIDTAIPEIVHFFRDSDVKVRLATAETLWELSDRGRTVNLLVVALLIKVIAEFRPLIVTAIPKLVALLKDSDIDVCGACTVALWKLSEQGKTGNLSDLALLMRILAECRALIGPAVLDMVKSFNDGDSKICVGYVYALSKLSQQGKRAN
jgi:Armadillo/beta-catenin-like repeat